MNIASQIDYPESIAPGRASPTAECNETRFNAIVYQKNLLFKHIEEFSKRIPLEEDTDNKIINTHELKQSIDAFRNFFEDYFKFFENGNKDEYQKRMSCECVLSKALAQIRSIWTRLSWAVNQRFIDIYEEKLIELNKEADKLMRQAPDLFSEKVERRPIIYLDKFIHITRYTYPTSPLIGIPIDRDIEESRLSLAHELGHHVFWNSGNVEDYTNKVKRIHNIIFTEFEFKSIENSDYETVVHDTKNKLEMFEVLKGWSEEILADIFATLLTGAEYAKSCQDILVRDSISNTDDYITDDGKHPIPSLRPLIAWKVLKIVAKKKQDEEGNTNSVKILTEIVDKLAERWRALTESNNNIHLRGVTEWKIEQLKGHLLNIVDKIVSSSKMSNAEGYALMDLVPYYWGSSGNFPTDEELKKFITRLDEDFLSKSPPPPVKIGNPPSDTPGSTQTYDKDFMQFLEYIRKQNKKYKSEYPVWEEILSLDLTQTEQQHTCQQISPQGWPTGKPC